MLEIPDFVAILFENWGINLSPTMIALPLLSSLIFVLDLIFGVYGCINHLEGDSTLVEELEL